MTPTAASDAPDAAVLRKFPCTACGADVVWNPGVEALKCPYCGTVRPVPQKRGEIVERPIEEGLRAPRDFGWGTARKTVRRQRCGATQSVEPGLAALRCAFCAAPAVVEAPASDTMVRPEGLLPFRITRDQAAGMFRSWLSRLWFRPGDLGEKAALSALQGVYVPFWTFDAATHSEWEAEAGTPYQVNVGGRAETRVRWEWVSGFLENGIGNLVPLILFLLPRLSVRRAAVGVVLVLSGVFMKRWNVVIGGQAFSLTFAGYMHYVLPIVPHGLVTAREGLVGALGVLTFPFVLFYVYSKFLPIFPAAESRSV